MTPWEDEEYSFQFFLSCISPWLSDVAMIARRSFQFFLSCITESSMFVYVFTSDGLSILSELHPKPGWAGEGRGLGWNFQFFLSCIGKQRLRRESCSTFSHLSILSELHPTGRANIVPGYLYLSILSELHPNFSTRGGFICLTFNFI